MQKTIQNNLKNVGTGNLILWLSFLLFLVYYLVIAYNNRLAAGDDLYFYGLLKEDGMFTFMSEYTENKRFSSYLLFNSIFYFSSDLRNANVFLFCYHVFSIVAFIGGFLLLIRTVFRQFFSFDLSLKKVLLIAFLALITVFFLNPQIIEVWFWTVATTIYAAPLIAFLFGAHLIISDRKSVFTFLLIGLCFLFIGGALETFAIVVLFILAALFLGPVFIFSSEFWKKKRTKLMIAILCISTILLLNVLDGGVESRIVVEEKSHAGGLPSWKGFLYSFVQAKNLLSLCALILLYYVGKQMKAIGLVLPEVNSRKYIAINILVLFIIGLITIIPLTLIFSGWGAERAWTPFHFFFSISLIIWSFYFGYHALAHWTDSLKGLLPIMLCTILIVLSKRQFPSVQNYSSHYDLMLDEVGKQVGGNREQALPIPVLPEPGMLVKFTLDQNPEVRNNQTFKKAMNINFDVYSEE